jgi:chromosome segregation protein
VVYASGLVAAGGKQDARHGLLAHNRQVAETRTRLEEARDLVASLEGGLHRDEEAVAALETSLSDARDALEEAGRRRVELGLKAQRSSEDRDKASRRGEVLDCELASLHEESARLDGELASAGREVGQIEDAHRELERRLAEENAALEVAESTLREAGEETGALRARLAARRQQQESEVREQQRLEELDNDLEERIASLHSEQAAARNRSAEAAQLMRATEGELAEHIRLRTARAAELQGMQGGIEEMRSTLTEQEKQLQRARGEFEAIRERTRESEVARARTEADRTHLDDLCSGELDVTAAEAADAAGEKLDEADLEELEAAIAEHRGKLEGIGPVNIMAIEEHTELEERYNFLSAQQEDLEKAMASLEETIRKINRTSRDRFLSAFEEIRQNYREIFAVLFNGGRADLKLEEGEDVLECGIEILAQPPGKRLGSVQLLSGGEKALSAIALLFAIFRYQPSPFCLLDEVDAALDDVNVGRFTRMLREYAAQSQFILITHNKVSMESANLLYGITMEEPGVSRVMSLQL